METEKKLKVLQMTYAAAIADSVLRLGREGVLEKVTGEKRLEQMKRGSEQAAQMGITKPREVFEVLSEIYGCANWKITENSTDLNTDAGGTGETGFTAEATGCMLCSMAKRMGAQSPCRIYCLNPMEALVLGIDADAEFKVDETLWEGGRCKVTVK